MDLPRLILLDRLPWSIWPILLNKAVHRPVLEQAAMADISASSSRPSRKRPRIDSYFEIASSDEDSTETPEAVPEATATRKTVSEQGTERYMPCAQCVSRALKTPGQKCHNQAGVGIACWQCAKNNKGCEPVS